MPRFTLTPAQSTVFRELIRRAAANDATSDFSAIVEALVLATGPELQAMLAPRLDAFKAELQAQRAAIDTQVADEKARLDATIADADQLALIL